MGGITPDLGGFTQAVCLAAAVAPGESDRLAHLFQLGGCVDVLPGGCQCQRRVRSDHFLVGSQLRKRKFILGCQVFDELSGPVVIVRQKRFKASARSLELRKGGPDTGRSGREEPLQSGPGQKR